MRRGNVREMKDTRRHGAQAIVRLGREKQASVAHRQYSSKVLPLAIVLKKIRGHGIIRFNLGVHLEAGIVTTSHYTA